MSQFDANIEHERAFFEALGRALVRWRGVEQELYLLYISLMRGADQKLISISFHQHQSFEAKLTLLTRCITLQSKLSKEWRPLKKKALALAPIRNQLVHAAFIIEGNPDGSQIPVLAPSFLDATAIVRDRAMNPKYRHDTERIENYSYDFTEFAGKLRVFREGNFAIAKKANRISSSKTRKSTSG